MACRYLQGIKCSFRSLSNETAVKKDVNVVLSRQGSARNVFKESMLQEIIRFCTGVLFFIEITVQ
jgi:hypothetical protein